MTGQKLLPEITTRTRKLLQSVLQNPNPSKRATETVKHDFNTRKQTKPNIFTSKKQYRNKKIMKTDSWDLPLHQNQINPIMRYG